MVRAQTRGLKSAGFSVSIFGTLAVSFTEVRSGESPRHLGISRTRDGAGKCREAISRLINDGSARTWQDDRHVSLSRCRVRRGTQRRRKVLIDSGLRARDPHSRSLQKGSGFVCLFVYLFYLVFFLFRIK